MTTTKSTARDAPTEAREPTCIHCGGTGRDLWGDCPETRSNLHFVPPVAAQPAAPAASEPCRWCGDTKQVAPQGHPELAKPCPACATSSAEPPDKRSTMTLPYESYDDHPATYRQPPEPDGPAVETETPQSAGGAFNREIAHYDGLSVIDRAMCWNFFYKGWSANAAARTGGTDLSVVRPKIEMLLSWAGAACECLQGELRYPDEKPDMDQVKVIYDNLTAAVRGTANALAQLNPNTPRGTDLKPLTDLADELEGAESGSIYNDTVSASSIRNECGRKLRAVLAQLKPLTPREAGILVAANRLSAAQAARTAYGRAAHYDPDECDKISWETQSAHKALMAALVADDTAEGVK